MNRHDYECGCQREWQGSTYIGPDLSASNRRHAAWADGLRVEEAAAARSTQRAVRWLSPGRHGAWAPQRNLTLQPVRTGV